MTKPNILVTRAIFPEVLEQLSQHFTVESNQEDVIMSADEMARRLQGKSGAFMTGTERVDAALLAQCPQLKLCANMSVGYNNFDVAAMTAAGVLGTNAHLAGEVSTVLAACPDAPGEPPAVPPPPSS